MSIFSLEVQYSLEVLLAHRRQKTTHPDVLWHRLRPRAWRKPQTLYETGHLQNVPAVLTMPGPTTDKPVAHNTADTLIPRFAA